MAALWWAFRGTDRRVLADRRPSIESTRRRSLRDPLLPLAIPKSCRSYRDLRTSAVERPGTLATASFRDPHNDQVNQEGAGDDARENQSLRDQWRLVSYLALQ